jgi:hypothetical protein
LQQQQHPFSVHGRSLSLTSAGVMQIEEGHWMRQRLLAPLHRQTLWQLLLTALHQPMQQLMLMASDAAADAHGLPHVTRPYLVVAGT